MLDLCLKREPVILHNLVENCLFGIMAVVGVIFDCNIDVGHREPSRNFATRVASILDHPPATDIECSVGLRPDAPVELSRGSHGQQVVLLLAAHVHLIKWPAQRRPGFGNFSSGSLARNFFNRFKVKVTIRTTFFGGIYKLGFGKASFD